MEHGYIQDNFQNPADALSGHWTEDADSANISVAVGSGELTFTSSSGTHNLYLYHDQPLNDDASIHQQTVQIYAKAGALPISGNRPGVRIVLCGDATFDNYLWFLLHTNGLDAGHTFGSTEITPYTSTTPKLTTSYQRIQVRGRYTGTGTIVEMRYRIGTGPVISLFQSAAFESGLSSYVDRKSVV